MRESSSSSSSSMVYKGRADPALFLNSEAMVHVLSFVEPTPSGRGGPSRAAGGTTAGGTIPNYLQDDRYYEDEDFDEMMDVKDEDGDEEHVEISDDEMENDTDTTPRRVGYSAPKVRVFHAQLETISPAWRSLVLEPGISQSVQLELDFDSMTDAFEDRGVAWVRSHKFPIKSISCGNKKLFVLASKTLKDCDTSQLTQAKLTLSLPDHSPAHFQYFHGDGSFSSQGHLQQTLATECPNLEHLDLVLKAKRGITSFGEAIRNGPALFSHPNITSLSIRICMENQRVPSLEQHTITNLIQNLPSLRSLTLICNSPTMTLPLQIRSKSLLILRVNDFFEQGVGLSLDCPRLQHLYMRAWGSDVLREVLRTLGIVGASPLLLPDRCIVHPKRPPFPLAGSMDDPQQPFPVSRLRETQQALAAQVMVP